MPMTVSIAGHTPPSSTQKFLLPVDKLLHRLTLAPENDYAQHYHRKDSSYQLNVFHES
jgi:hypothetical protein